MSSRLVFWSAIYYLDGPAPSPRLRRRVHKIRSCCCSLVAIAGHKASLSCSMGKSSGNLAHSSWSFRCRSTPKLKRSFSSKDKSSPSNWYFRWAWGILSIISLSSPERPSSHPWFWLVRNRRYLIFVAHHHLKVRVFLVYG